MNSRGEHKLDSCTLMRVFVSSNTQTAVIAEMFCTPSNFPSALIFNYQLVSFFFSGMAPDNGVAVAARSLRDEAGGNMSARIRFVVRAKLCPIEI